MDIRVIVFGMCIVLVCLFIAANFYIPRAKERSLKEAAFGAQAQIFLKNPTQENYAKCLESAEAYLRAKKSNLDVKDFLSQEKITFQSASS